MSTVTVSLSKLQLAATISKDDVSRFAELAERIVASGRTDVVTELGLNSPGGDVMAALAIGEIVRKDWIFTQVYDDAECASACVLILAAGAHRMVGERSTVAIHRPYFEPKFFRGLDQAHAKAKYDELAASVRAYLSNMGMSDQLFLEMMKVSSRDVRTLSDTEMETLNLLGSDPGYDEWLRARNVAKYGEALWRQYEDWVQRETAYGQACVATRPQSEDELQSWSYCLKQFGRTEARPARGKMGAAHFSPASSA